jgi:Holliday junction DNA helicase RuvB
MPYFDDDPDPGYEGGGPEGAGGGFPWMAMGAGYALYRHGQDQQTAQLLNAQRQPVQVTVNVNTDEDERVPHVNMLDFTTADIPEWDDYIGQENLKRQVMIRLKAAQSRGERFPHTLLASGFPGVGKTTMARLIAKMMGVPMTETMAPISAYTLAEAAMALPDHGVLFIDEIHGLANNGKRGAEVLLKALEDGIIYLSDGTVCELPNITIIGATTDKDMLPEPVIDRFRFRPEFSPYTDPDLCEIASTFVSRHKAWDAIIDQSKPSPENMAILWDLALACRNTPRIVEEYILAARDLAVALNRPPTAQEVLELVEVEPDGMTKQHINYITAMRTYFPRELKEGGYEFVVGEPAIMQMLRETKQGIARIERFLIERGLLDRTPRGRRLTDRGVARAEAFIAEGKGIRDV